jgi:GNAT superfamily N-acetyltransferase
MNDLSLTIRSEAAGDAQAIERLHERTFGPGRFVLSAYRIREHVDHVLDLSFTARVGTLLIGSVRQLPICVGDTPALLLGPLTVEPPFRSRGVGRLLLERALKDAKEKAFLKTTTRDENAHVKALKAALGKKAIAKPKFDFKGTTKSRKAFIDTAFVLENEGVHAYSGQALNIKDPAIVAAALSIVTIEARHASVIGIIKSATPKGISPDGPFDTPFTAKKVLKDVGATGFIVG